MQLTLDEKWTERLIELPESGMGYQRVCVLLKDGRILDDVLVFNAEVLQVPDDVRPFVLRDILEIRVREPSPTPRHG